MKALIERYRLFAEQYGTLMLSALYWGTVFAAVIYHEVTKG